MFPHLKCKFPGASAPALMQMCSHAAYWSSSKASRDADVVDMATPQSPARSEAVAAVAGSKATTPTVQSSEWDESKSKEPEVPPAVAVNVDNIDSAAFTLADYAEYLHGDVDYGDIDVDNIDFSEFAEFL